MNDWVDTHGYSLAGYLAAFGALTSYGYWLVIRSRRVAALLLARQGEFGPKSSQPEEASL